jgi:hypothetical protein
MFSGKEFQLHLEITSIPKQLKNPLIFGGASVPSQRVSSTSSTDRGNIGSDRMFPEPSINW